MPGQGISIGSQRNFSNSFIIDGVSANDDAAGVAGTFVGLDVVNEFQVVTSGGQAELGRALGGYVNVVTKSGGNTMHGGRLRIFPEQPLSMRRTRFPIRFCRSRRLNMAPAFRARSVRDRTFYFTNFEGRDLNQSNLVTISPANVAAINAHLLASDFPGRWSQRATFEIRYTTKTSSPKSIIASATRTSSAPATVFITWRASTRAERAARARRAHPQTCLTRIRQLRPAMSYTVSSAGW